MLARTFLTANDLDIPQEWLDALIRTLGAMERGEFRHVPYVEGFSGPPGNEFRGAFNMRHWRYSRNTKTDCGTICCIGGAAEILGNVDFFEGGIMPIKLDDLFHPGSDPANWMNRDEPPYETITVEQAAQALRNYLTVGDPQWRTVLGLDK